MSTSLFTSNIYLPEIKWETGHKNRDQPSFDHLKGPSDTTGSRNLPHGLPALYIFTWQQTATVSSANRLHRYIPPMVLLYRRISFMSSRSTIARYVVSVLPLLLVVLFCPIQGASLTDVPVSGGDTARFITWNYAEQMAQTPLWIFHGSDDELSPVENDQAIYNSIRDAGGTLVKYTEYSGLGHVAGIEAARYEPGLLEWLLSQDRQTGIVPGPDHGGDTGRSSDRFRYLNGTLYASTLFPGGTTVSLFDLNGRLHYTATAAGSYVRIPSLIAEGAVLWRLSHPTFSASGRVPFSAR